MHQAPKHRFNPWIVPLALALAVVPAAAALAAFPSCEISGATTLPSGSTFHLCGTGSAGEGNTYSWYDENMNLLTHDQCVDISGLSAGGHDITFVMSLGDSFRKCPVHLEVTEGPPELLCPEVGAQCSGQGFQVCGPNQGEGFTYTWTGPGIVGEVHTRCVDVSALGAGDYILHYVVSFNAPSGNFRKCDVPVHVADCGQVNCPHTVGFWSQQCAQKGNGSTKYSHDEVASIAGYVDAHLSSFDWSNDFDGFCAVINPDKPMTLVKQTRRQLAGLMANVAAGELDLVTSNGQHVQLSLDTPFSCSGASDVHDIGDLVDLANQLLGQSSPDQQLLGAVEACLDAVNNGIGIGRVCGDEVKSLPIGALSPSTDDARVLAVRPNPFTSGTSLTFALQSPKQVELGVYDVSGRLVRRLTSGAQDAGTHVINWDGRDASGARVKTGVYFVRGTIGGAATGSRLLVIH